MRRAALIIAAALLIAWVALPILPSDADELSGRLLDREGRTLHVSTTADGYYRLPVKLETVDPAYIRALVAIEDRRFWHHPGVDPLAILRALKSNANAGEIVSGASTITQQLGRQYRPRPRTYRSKLIEAVEAIRLDQRLSKREQLERYLSRISYGGNIQGLKAASQIWLGKSPQYLRPDEVALLLALPQSPEARRPDRNPVAAKAGRDLILDRMVEAGLIKADVALIAKAEPIATQRRVLPNENFLALDAIGSGPSYLDSQLQDHVRRTLADYVSRQPRSVNAAAILIHAPTREVRALVGTGARDHSGGWIDMTDRLRSPGSTLKPFIYAMARDDGTLDYQSDVRDAPTRFGTYRPENFTRRYHGRVSISEALQHSLNVPAVAALSSVGADRFRATLAAAGPQTRGRVGDDQGEGLALALGGTGLSARDLAVLYTALANEGEAGALRFRSDAPERAPYRLMSAETADETLSVLRGAPRPKDIVNMKGAPRIAYKTGTSYGYRDHWAAGVRGEYVAIVWTGRPDGAPRPGHTGRETAAPLLFEILSAVGGDAPVEAPKRHEAPLALRSIENQAKAPDILFPADGSEVVAEFGDEGRGISISVNSDHPVQLFVDGAPITRQADLAIWKPAEAGFYTITASDPAGRSTNANIRVVSRDQLPDAPF